MLQLEASLSPILRNPLTHPPHVSIEFSTSRFLVKTATTALEQLEVFHLRYHHFFQEFTGRSNSRGVDVDSFDQDCDYLLVRDLKTQAVVGTYRIICDAVHDKFYSGTEFDLSIFSKRPGPKVELSRACIHPDYRNGMVIMALWKGVFEYLVRSEARYLFGLSSIQPPAESSIAGVIQQLKHRQWVDPSLGVTPLSAPEIGDEISQMAKVTLPPLFKAYFKAGAMAAGMPAYDPECLCYDFFTVLDTRKLNQSHRRKFG